MIKIYNKQEQGRSMTEMLGVLAIIGVLSIGGIAGYRYAMNKHYANELLLGASERVVLVTAQVTAGREPSLKEFANQTTAGGTFATDKVEVYSDGIGIKVSGVNGAVCENLIKATEDTDIVIADTQGKALSAGDCKDDTNDLLFVFETGIGSGKTVDPACADVKCEDGLMCFHGECKCPNGLLMCGDQCCAEGTYCAKGADRLTHTCAKPSGECSQNSDCKDAEGNVDTSKYCHFSGGDCAGPTDGTCTDKGTLTEYTLNLPKGKLTVYKGDSMNWWSVSNLCEAHEKQMVTMADLGLSDPVGAIDCCFDHELAEEYGEGFYKCICSGGDLDCSQTAGALYAMGISGYLWLADSSKLSSCTVRDLGIDDGAVGGNGRYYSSNLYSALCR